ncbi:uncharacterized protein KY384_003199 [Bacidia gigantensis]|uniref:uncharacterized protein n=1 Tax=Bacidia gigantensis TaxID=2732470 RepID=UPI001D050AA0|nr:uncharacterized protein KY384_003199 [Bacidia gigantensis]KAG8531569.1 hypothetical protein KY384_003199 [Bacidia gigantensis]
MSILCCHRFLLYLPVLPHPLVPQKRTIILTDLPEYATSSFISSIVYGGNLEQIRLDRFGCKAWIRFLDPAACQKFYENSDNGLVYGKENNGKEKIVWVDLGKDVNVIGGNLREQIARGCTRSVKVVPVEEDFTKMALETFAARGRRSVEGLEEGRSSPNNKRTVIFRFTEIEHAVQFHGTLKSDADWEQCNINYVDDP